MSYMRRYKPKNVTLDSENPGSIGFCQRSTFLFDHKDLVKQMDWFGNNLLWTGEWVGKRYLDVPNEQNRPPLVKSDPKPVTNPSALMPHSPPPPTVPPYNQLMAKLNNFKWNNNE